MSWEWSHSPEAYGAVRENIEKQSREWLEDCWAEIASADFATNRDGQRQFDLKTYAKHLETAGSMEPAELAEAVWNFVEAQRACGIGGYAAYCCPFHCHEVPFEPQEES